MTGARRTANGAQAAKKKRERTSGEGAWEVDRILGKRVKWAGWWVGGGSNRTADGAARNGIRENG